LPWLPKIALVIGFHVFLVCAAIHDFEKATELFILVALGYLTLFYYLWGEKWLEQFSESAIRPLVKTIAPIFSLKLGRLSVVKWYC
jgi:hypothetical protein